MEISVQYLRNKFDAFNTLCFGAAAHCLEGNKCQELHGAVLLQETARIAVWYKGVWATVENKLPLRHDKGGAG